MSKLLDRITNYILRSPNQETVIKYLRTLNFKFHATDSLESVFKIKIKPLHSGFSFMVRERVDKEGERIGHDERLIVGIKLIGKKVDTIILYRDLKFNLKVIKGWKDNKKVNFKKVKIKMVFPESLNYKERRDWRAEHAKVQRNPDYIPTKFYTRNKDKIRFI